MGNRHFAIFEQDREEGLFVGLAGDLAGTSEGLAGNEQDEHVELAGIES